MALEFVRAGMVAVATDHPGSGEGLERLGDKLLGGATRDKLCRDLLYLGRSFLGLSTFQKSVTLRWMKTLPFIDSDRLAVAGHSLGTEACLTLGVIDPDVSAVVLNDFIHGKRVQDIALAKTMNDKHVYYTGGMWHTVPGLWQWFDLPDLAAAIAPRSVLATEGGTAFALPRVQRAFELAGRPEGFEYHHFPEFDTPEERPYDDEPMPEGLLMDEYFFRAHTSPQNHYFKGHLAVPWLSKQFGLENDP
jgi:pimeloyl-ACP methyl ester carboxylesterase